MEQLALVCIDNIECVAGDERLISTNPDHGIGRAAAITRRSAAAADLGLPDLASAAAGWGQICHKPAAASRG